MASSSPKRDSIHEEAITITIPSYVKKESYTLYTIDVKSTITKWTVQKRFSSVDNLHQELQKAVRNTTKTAMIIIM